MAADPPVTLVAPASLSVPRLLVEHGWRVDVGPTTQCAWQLHDTGDRRLTAGGAELRLQARGGWIWWRGSAGHPRLEPRAWTAPRTEDGAVLRRWTRAHHRGAPLEARAEVRVRRRRHRAQAIGGAHPAVEIDDERIELRTGATWQVRLRRLTVAAAGSRSGRAVHAVLAEHAVPAEGTLLALLDPDSVRAPRLQPTGASPRRPCDVVRQSMALATLQWLYYDSEIAGGDDPDALRKLRVALRRLRSDLQTFRPLLDAGWADSLRGELGGLASELGAARDAEVCARRVGELSAGLDEDDRPAALVLRSRAQADAAGMRAHLEAFLDAEDYLALVDRLVRAVSSPRCVDAGAASLRQLAVRPWRRLRRLVGDLEERPSAADLHRLRIQVKRTRSAVDACAPVVGSAASVAAQLLAGLQTILGDHHDASLVIAWLRTQARGDATVGYAAGQMVALEARRQEEAATAWRTAWAEVSRQRHWRWLSA